MATILVVQKEKQIQMKLIGERNCLIKFFKNS